MRGAQRRFGNDFTRAARRRSCGTEGSRVVWGRAGACEPRVRPRGGIRAGRRDGAPARIRRSGLPLRVVGLRRRARPSRRDGAPRSPSPSRAYSRGDFADTRGTHRSRGMQDGPGGGYTFASQHVIYLPGPSYIPLHQATPKFGDGESRYRAAAAEPGLSADRAIQLNRSSVTCPSRGRSGTTLTAALRDAVARRPVERVSLGGGVSTLRAIGVCFACFRLTDRLR